MRDYITCEQCGNDFRSSKVVVKDNKEYIQCPYCRYLNKRVDRKNKKRGARK